MGNRVHKGQILPKCHVCIGSFWTASMTNGEKLLKFRKNEHPGAYLDKYGIHYVIRVKKNTLLKQNC